MLKQICWRFCFIAFRMLKIEALPAAWALRKIRKKWGAVQTFIQAKKGENKRIFKIHYDIAPMVNLQAVSFLEKYYKIFFKNFYSTFWLWF